MDNAPSEHLPVVLFRNDKEVQREDMESLYMKLKGSELQSLCSKWKNQQVDDTFKSRRIRGIRVFYFCDKDRHCDHAKYHDEKWLSKLNGEKCLEAGTVIALSDFVCGAEQERHFLVVIQWDCGFKRAYSEEEFQFIRVLDLGPAGYKGEMVFCDKCLFPVMGFSWRLVKCNGSKDSYDLCFTHYNENEDPYAERSFYCIIPSGDIELKNIRKSFKPRSQSKTFKLVGLFKGAKVEDLTKDREFKEGTIFKIEHQNKYAKTCGSVDSEEEANGEKDVEGDANEDTQAQEDIRYAKYYNCCAEIIPATGKPLVYRNVGGDGKIDVKLHVPGEWGSIFPDHHPTLSFKMLREISTYEDCLHKMNDGNTCFMRRDENQNCFSLTICDTEFKSRQITDERVWKECKHLRTFILYMTNLLTLPPELERFKNDIALLCIMHNSFSKIPEITYKFKNLEELVMHGSHLPALPEDISIFKNLTKLYLGSNELSFLPNVFDKFPRLREVSFAKNKLQHLPSSFSELSCLKSLDISDNALFKFPECLLKIKSLIFLNIEGNRIQRFSPAKAKNSELYDATFSFICQLERFQINGNPVCQHSCLKSVHKSQSKVLEALKSAEIFEQLSQIELTRSLRINVLGEVGSGKTSVVQAFTMHKYVIPTTQRAHFKTVGIDRYYFPAQIGGKTIMLHIWDHAGDDEYAMMNDMFISNKSLVWLVVNLEKYSPTDSRREQSIFEKHIGHWLLQVMLHNSMPTVWIICTHSDTGRNMLKTDHMHFWIGNLCRKFQERKDSSSESTSDEFNSHAKLLCKHLKEHLKILVLTNTYSFEGLDQLQVELEELPNNSPPFSDLMTPLPVEYESALECLQSYSEKEMLSCSNIPALFTDNDENEFDKEILSKMDGASKESFNKDEFLEYLHNSGEIYYLREEKVAVLNLDWLIYLLEQVYRHDFDENLSKAGEEVDFEAISDADRLECSELREKKGLISESILKPLWGCKNNDGLFNKIVKLFKHFNLTYSVKKESMFYYFPYLSKKSELPNEPELYYQGKHITLVYKFKFFFPKFFLQRLALKLWESDNSRIDIYRSGFKAHLKSGVTLLISRLKTTQANTQGMRIIVFSNSTEENVDSLWKVLQEVSVSIHSLLLSYWKFCGHTELSVSCPHCTPKPESAKTNSLQLMKFAGNILMKQFQSKTMLKCNICNGLVFIEDMVPTLNFFEHDCNQCVCIREINGQEDLKKYLANSWELRERTLQDASTADGDLPSYPRSEGDRFAGPSQAES